MNRSYAALALAALVLVPFEIQATLDVVRTWRHSDSLYDLPFAFETGSRRIGNIRVLAVRAGLRPGDEVLRIDKREVRGLAPFLDFHKPTARIDLLRDGTPMSVITPLIEVPRQFSAAQGRILGVMLRVVMPWLCLILAFAAPAIRPRDGQAWLVFGLLVTFPQLFQGDSSHWPEEWRVFGAVVRGAMLALLPVAITLFATYFIEPLVLDRRVPAIKYLIGGAGAATGLALGFLNVVMLADLEAFPALQIAAQLPASLFSYVLFLSIGWFFACMGQKLGMSKNPDAKRRLRLLFAGTQVAMAPLFVLIVVAFFTSRMQMDFLPPGLLTVALLMTFLFPATILYVILVHRALDLRVVLRQSIQYALVRGGARVAMVVLIVAIVTFAVELINEPGVRRVDKYATLGAAVALVLLIRRMGGRTAQWIDRRFFRQAYDADRVLGELADQVRTIVDANALMQTLAHRISDTLHVPRLAFLAADGGSFRPAYAIGYGAGPDVAFPSGGATVAQLRSDPVPARVYWEDKSNWAYRVAGDERALLERLEAELILPLAVKEDLLGFVTLSRKRSEEPYSGSDLRLLRSVAAQSALALENSRLAAAFAREAAQREKLNREVEIAREVQERLFPQKTPAVDGIDCAGACIPALGVGGDYYDFLTLGGGKLGVVIGDVAGKGIAAALLMASLQASIRSQAPAAGDELGAMIGRVNTLIYESSATSRYATLFYSVLDPATLTLDYVNAGHNPPILFRASGEIEHLNAGGTVVGLLPRFPYQQARVQLQPGDVLVTFTDGVSEANNHAEEEWGEDKLIEAVRGAGPLGARELITHVVNEANVFVAGAPQHDDMTMVIVRVAAGGGAAA